MLDTIAHINALSEEYGITEVSLYLCQDPDHTKSTIQPSLMNFCVTDGDTVVATRYISSRTDEAASLVSDSTLVTYVLV